MIKRSFTAFLAVAALMSLSAVGCAVQPGTGTETGNGQGGLGSTNPGVQDPSKPGPAGGGTTGEGTPCQGKGIKVMAGCTAPQGTYVAMEDQAEAKRIADEMWAVMTGSQCWFMEGTTQQYVFYDALQYTFWGMSSDSKSFGTLQVTSVGRYENMNAGTVMLRGEPWMITIRDAGTLYMGKVQNGQPYVQTYRAHNDNRCL